MRSKIRENLRTASFNLKFTGYNKVFLTQNGVVSFAFVLYRLVAFITRQTD